jgi:hypothetical protein
VPVRVLLRTLNSPRAFILDQVVGSGPLSRLSDTPNIFSFGRALQLGGRVPVCVKMRGKEGSEEQVRMLPRQNKGLGGYCPGNRIATCCTWTGAR